MSAQGVAQRQGFQIILWASLQGKSSGGMGRQRNNLRTNLGGVLGQSVCSSKPAFPIKGNNLSHVVLQELKEFAMNLLQICYKFAR